MDPLTLITNCYALYGAIKEKLDTVKSNRHQFDLLKIRMEHIKEPLLQLQKLQKEGHLPCSSVVLNDFHKFLQEIAEFVAQKRFQEQSQAMSSALRWLSEAYFSSDDQAQFIEFDKQISNHLQSLNLHVTVQLLDYARAAHQDTAKAAAEVHSMELRMIDMKKLVWDPSKAKNNIGTGTFSNVIVGQYNKEYVAIKQVKDVDKMTPSDLKTIQKEAMIMQYANHRNILAIKGANLSKGIIVMELAVCSLSDYLYRADPTAQERARPLLAAAAVPTLQWRVDVIRDVSDAVRYLHAHNILHRDIKSPNVLLFRDPSTGVTTAKLGDFGLALAVELASRTAGTSLTTGPAAVHRAVGTYSYMAPELFDREPGKRVPYSEASDVYSLGVLVNEVMSGRTPWEASAREADIQNWVFHKRLRPKLWDLTGAWAGGGAGEAGDLYAGRAQRLRDLLGHSDGLHCCWSHQPHQRCTAVDLYAAATFMPKVSTNPIHVLWTESNAEASQPMKLIPESTAVSMDMEAGVIRPGVSASNSNAQPRSRMLSSSPAARKAEPSGWFSSFRNTTGVTKPDPQQDVELTEKREEFALHIMQTFPDIPSSSARSYAAALFAASVYTVPRLLQLIQEKGKSDTEYWRWRSDLGIILFDGMDMRERTGSAPALNKDISFATLEVQHGADRLVEWLAQHVPDLPLQSKRRRVAELLCKARITCVSRLVRRVRDVEWLVKLGVDRLDAEDIVTAATAAASSADTSFPEVNSTKANLGGMETPESVVTDFAADLRCVVPDMSAELALQYCTDLLPCSIYTVNRLLRVLKKEGTPFLKKLEWHDFDSHDALYLTIVPAEQLKRLPLPNVDKLHGVEVLSLWLLDHVPNITLSSFRTSYCKALLQHNVSTVQRLARHGCSEAWLVGIGISQLDAKDMVAALQSMHDKDSVVMCAGQLKREAEERERRIAEEQRQKAESKHPAKDWQGADSHWCICFKPCCESLLAPDHILCLLAPCLMYDEFSFLGLMTPVACLGWPCVYPIMFGLCCVRSMGVEVDQECAAVRLAFIAGSFVCFPVCCYILCTASDS